jgi:hypothetical protein
MINRLILALALLCTGLLGGLPATAQQKPLVIMTSYAG